MGSHPRISGLLTFSAPESVPRPASSRLTGRTFRAHGLRLRGLRDHVELLRIGPPIAHRAKPSRVDVKHSSPSSADSESFPAPAFHQPPCRFPAVVDGRGALISPRLRIRQHLSHPPAENIARAINVGRCRANKIVGAMKVSL